MHAFKDINCQCIGDIHECSTVHPKYSDHYFLFFCQNAPVQPFYASNDQADEELENHGEGNDHPLNYKCVLANLAGSEEEDGDM